MPPWEPRWNPGTAVEVSKVPCSRLCLLRGGVEAFCVSRCVLICVVKFPSVLSYFIYSLFLSSSLPWKKKKSMISTRSRYFVITRRREPGHKSFLLIHGRWCVVSQLLARIFGDRCRKCGVLFIVVKFFLHIMTQRRRFIFHENQISLYIVFFSTEGARFAIESSIFGKEETDHYCVDSIFCRVFFFLVVQLM